MPIYRDKTAGCWIFDFDRRIEGQRVRHRQRLPKAWSRTQADAFDRKESARLYAIASGIERPAVGIQRAVELYLTERGPALKHGRRVGQVLALIEHHYDGRTLDELPAVCEAIQRECLQNGLKPATARNRVRYLTSAARWAWKRHGLTEHDPAERIYVPEVNNARDTTTDLAGIDAICTKADCPETRALARIAFFTGMRVGEIFAARLVGNTFELDDTKNGRPRHIPIVPAIRKDVKLLPFRFARSTLEKRYRKARAAAGLPTLHLHDIRHSTATAMVNAGEDLATVGAVLGHRSAQSTLRYAHHSTQRQALALGKIGRKVPQAPKRKRA